MANPQDMEQVARIAGQQLGAPAPAEKPEADPKPTTQETAQKVGSPETEGDRSQMEAVMYEIEVNGNKRNLTPQQISSTLERYSSLNHQHAQMKPVIELAKQLMQGTKGDANQAAGLITKALRAMTKNTELGRATEQKQAGTATPQTKATMQQSMEEALAKYEEDNAITLPPGYREQMMKLGQMEQMMGKQMQAMNSILQRSQ